MSSPLRAMGFDSSLELLQFWEGIKIFAASFREGIKIFMLHEVVQII